MTQSRPLIALLMVLAAPVLLLAKRVDVPRGTANDPLEVHAVVETYVDGLRLQDVDRLAGVIHPQARMSSSSSGQDVVRPFVEWVQAFGIAAELDGGGPLPLRSKITGFEVKGRKAKVRVMLESDHAIYNNDLALEKIEGEWQITQRHLCWSSRV